MTYHFSLDDKWSFSTLSTPQWLCDMLESCGTHQKFTNCKAVIIEFLMNREQCEFWYWLIELCRLCWNPTCADVTDASIVRVIWDLEPTSVNLIKDKIPQLPQACLMAQPKMGTVLYDTECLTTWSLTLTVYYWNSATNMSLKKLWFFQFTGLNFNQLENKMSSWL